MKRRLGGVAIFGGWRNGPQCGPYGLRGLLAVCWACSAGYDLRIVFDYAQHVGAEAILLLAVGMYDEVY